MTKQHYLFDAAKQKSYLYSANRQAPHETGEEIRGSFLKIFPNTTKKIYKITHKTVPKQKRDHTQLCGALPYILADLNPYSTSPSLPSSYNWLTKK